MRRVGNVVGVVLVLLGVFWVGRESAHGLAALWEHWWCPIPIALVVVAAGAWIVAGRPGSRA
jgi:hypothetical protein